MTATVFPPNGLTFAYTPAVSGTPPNPATNPIPADAVSNVLNSTHLSWSSGGGGPTGYLISFGNDYPPTNIEDEANMGLVTTYTPASPLAYSTTYYWKITPYNGNGSAAGCPIWSFTTGANPTISSFPYTEGFEGTFPPYGWNNVEGLWSKGSESNSGTGLQARMPSGPPVTWTPA